MGTIASGSTAPTTILSAWWLTWWAIRAAQYRVTHAYGAVHPGFGYHYPNSFAEQYSVSSGEWDSSSAPPHLFSKKQAPKHFYLPAFFQKAGHAKTLFSHLRNHIFFAPFRKKVPFCPLFEKSRACKNSLFAPFRKKVPKTFQPKLRFGEFDDVRVFVLVAGLILSRGFIAFYCEGLVVCDNNTKRK